MKQQHLEAVKALIEEIADSYDLPDEEQVEEMNRLTGMDWDAEELQMYCFEYWSRSSLEETVYAMFHGTLPPTQEVELVFWRAQPGAVLDDQAVYEKYQLGKGTLNALEPLPLEELLGHVREALPDWKEEDNSSGESEQSYRFSSEKWAHYWSDPHFWIFPYGRETELGRDIQMLCISFHNVEETVIQRVLQCMEAANCPLHIRTDRIVGGVGKEETLRPLLAERRFDALYREVPAVLDEMLLIQSRAEFEDFLAQGQEVEEEAFWRFYRAALGKSLLLDGYEGDVTEKVQAFLRKELPRAVYSQLEELLCDIQADLDEDLEPLEDRVEEWNARLSGTPYTLELELEDTYCSGVYFLSVQCRE